MTQISNSEAARLIYGEATSGREWRILPEVLAGRQELLFQFESGLAIHWDPLEGRFEKFVDRKLAAEWRNWKEAKRG